MTSSPRGLLAGAAGADRLFALGLAAACALAGVVAALFVHAASFEIIVGAVAVLLAAAVSYGLAGLRGSLLVLVAFNAFLLLNRLDEVIALPFGAVYLRLSLVVTLSMIVAIGTINLLVSPYHDEARNRLSRRFYILVGLFLAWAAVTMTINRLLDYDHLSREFSGQLAAILALVGPALLVPAIVRAQLNPRHTRWLLRGVIGLAGLGGFLMGVFGLLPGQITGLLGWTETTGGTSDLVRGRLPLGHPNAVAAVMLLMLPLSVLLGLSARDRLWRPFYLACAATMFTGVLFSLSRSALLNVGLIVAATLCYYFYAEREQRVLGVLIGSAVGMLFVGVAAYLFTNYDFSRFWSRGYHEEASVERRLDSMMTAVKVWRDHPLHGAGPDSLYPRLELRPGWEPPVSDVISPIFYYRGNITAETPHNFYLHLLAEFGLVGALVFWALLALVLSTLWRLRSHPGLASPERHLLMGLFIGLCGFLLAGMFEALLMTSFRASMLFWLMAGLALHLAFQLAPRRDARTP